MSAGCEDCTKFERTTVNGRTHCCLCTCSNCDEDYLGDVVECHEEGSVTLDNDTSFETCKTALKQAQLRLWKHEVKNAAMDDIQIRALTFNLLYN